jgi:hypothetical protein
MTSSSCWVSRAFDGSWTSWLKAVSLRGWGARRLGILFLNDLARSLATAATRSKLVLSNIYHNPKRERGIANPGLDRRDGSIPCSHA